mgnify:CR=1 FL=1
MILAFVLVKLDQPSELSWTVVLKGPSGRQVAAEVKWRRGKVTDVDGTTYVDLHNGFGAMLVGHAHPAVVEAALLDVRRTFGIEDVLPHSVLAHIDRMTTGSSCPWNLSTVPTRTPGRRRSRRRTCRL